MDKEEESQDESHRKIQAQLLDLYTREAFSTRTVEIQWGNPPLKDGKQEVIKFKWLLTPTIY